VHGLGLTESQRPFYAMRFIRGETYDLAIHRYHNPLTTRNASDRSLEFRGLLARFISVCNTLAYAHNCGIVHRDIKPDNIMLGRYAETLVVDWGLALAVDRDEMAKRSGEATLMPSSGSQAGGSSGGPAGTPAYMAPEQARDCDHVDRRADIYSLGVVLYKILCGQLPYKDASSPLQMMELLQRGNFPKPSEIDRSIPPALEAICLRAMATLPEKRYDTALDLAADLEHWLADEPVSVYREPLLTRSFRWVKNHQHIAFAIASVVLIALVSSLVSAIGLGTYAQTESLLRANSEAARQQSLRSATLLAAETVGREIHRRWELLERVTLDPELTEMLSKSEADPQDPSQRKLLQAWLTSIGGQNEKSMRFDTLFLVNADGVQLARYPLDEGLTIGKSFAHRDYFNGRGRDDSETERSLTAKPKSIQRPHLSTVYQSSSDQSLKVAVSVPIWSDKAGVPERRILGVIGMSVELNRFGGLLERKLPGNQVVELIDMRFDELTGKPQRGLILHHPALQKQKFAIAPRLSAEFIQSFLMKGVARLWESQQSARGNPPLQSSPYVGPIPQEPVNELILEYIDPVDSTKERWLAAYSTVWIAGRANSNEGGGPEAYLDTGWIVLVKERLE
jgi:serine/threonine-protein kinase